MSCKCSICNFREATEEMPKLPGLFVCWICRMTASNVLEELEPDFTWDDYARQMGIHTSDTCLKGSMTCVYGSNPIYEAPPITVEWPKKDFEIIFDFNKAHD